MTSYRDQKRDRRAQEDEARDEIRRQELARSLDEILDQATSFHDLKDVIRQVAARAGIDIYKPNFLREEL